MKKLILLAATATLLVACDKYDARQRNAHDNNLYLPPPGDNTSWHVCSKLINAKIASPTVECTGAIFTCNGIPMVRCANGDTYFNLTDIKVDGSSILRFDQLNFQ